MATIRLIVRYDGAALSGWQRQRNARTVQEELERSASEMAGETIRVHGAGRTDAGVHALAQVASFETRAQIPMKGWRLGLNSKLPPEISVIEAREAQDGFDPRRASAGKRYRYLVLNAASRDPLLRDRSWHVYDKLDLEALERGAAKLVGVHDFRGFRAADCERESTVRHVFCVRVRRDYAGVPSLVALEVEGTAFLKNMVRIITGTLVDTARGRLAESVIDEVLATGDRTRAGITAPPYGLYLDEVWIRPEYRLPDDSLALRPSYADAILEATPRVTQPDQDDDDE
ncbi:MAG: tRNA pseudouridine(38-40) synthase TruA [Myxococcales bacterium]|nr:tRNA pseudouridine(38-40) synthase TruA [Myxococcales bacterium]